MIKDKIQNTLTDIIVGLNEDNGWDLSSRGTRELAKVVIPHILASDVERKDGSFDEVMVRKIICNYFHDGPTVELWKQPYESAKKSHSIEECINYMKNNARRTFPGFLDSDIEDLVQESWIMVDAAIKGFHFRSRLSTWVHLIVANCCKQQLRKANTDKRKIEKKALSIDELEFMTGDISRLHDSNISLISNDQYRDPQSSTNLDTLAFLKAEIDSVCAQMREIRNTASGRKGVSKEVKKQVAYRRFLLDSTNSEIAEEMGLNLNTVNTIINRIQKYLLESIALKEWFGINSSELEIKEQDEVY